MQPGDLITCSCCGTGIRHTPDENRHFDVTPYPDDEGFGMCRECGGDPDATDVRERLGWALCAFVDARIPIIANALNEQNRARFLALPYAGKAHVVLQLVERGAIT